MLINNHMPCPRSECGSSDAASIYQNTNEDTGEIYHSGFCFSCSKYLPPSMVADFYKGDFKAMAADAANKPPPDFTPILRLDSNRGWRERRLGREVCEFYGVRSEFEGDTVTGQYYPITKGGELVGFKKRLVPKDFFSIGTNSSTCEFFGQNVFSKGGKIVVLTGGEVDAMSLFQTLKQYNPKYTTPVVSPTVGEGHLAKQIRANYNWLASFEKVIIMMDNDEAGQKAADEAAKILPVGKAFLAKLRLKDPNEYVKQKLESELVDAFWRAERYSPVGIVGSSDTYEALLQRAVWEKIPLPIFASELSEKLNGGPALGEITTIVSASGTGKSTVTNEFCYHWVMESSYKAGIIPLESDIGELTENLLSLHLGKKLANMPDEEKLQYLRSSEAKAAHKTLTVSPNGEDRYVIVDHQGDLVDDDLKQKMEYLVKVCGCKIIILDPLTLALSGGGNAETDEFMSWLLRFVKREMISCINVVHVRKNQAGTKANSTGADIHEENIKGSGSQFQVSMNNILLMRDKENPDPIIRNTTRVMLSKCRRTGKTGPAGFWYYDNNTSRLIRLEDVKGDFSEDEKTMEEAGVFGGDKGTGDFY